MAMSGLSARNEDDRPKVVVLGGAGMLGHKIFQALRLRYPGTITVVRKDVKQAGLRSVGLLQGPDVVHGVGATDFNALRRRLEGWTPEFIVNCVGIVKQRDEATSAIPSITVNALLPHRLAEAAAGWGGRLIHFSTDCVFSGRTGGYREDDLSDAEDLYGRTKFLGEVTGANAVTLRTSIIGRELTTHRSLLDWFLSQNGTTVRGFRRVMYSGVTTIEMAKVVARIIDDHPKLTGLFHVASEPITKHDLLGLVRDAYGLRIVIEPDDTEVSDRDLNYNVYFTEGRERISQEDDYHSHNTRRLDVDEMVRLLLDLEFVRREPQGWRRGGAMAEVSP
jgi:dTDP-4-dehydrorhamnose reductase